MKLCGMKKNELAGSPAAYRLLAHMILSEHGISMPEIKKTVAGKPYFSARPDIHFSISHSRTHVLCAVGDSPVGCDIEAPREVSRRVIDYAASAEELEVFDFLDLWVLKESYIKLFGLTLASVRKLYFSIHNDVITAPDPSVFCKLYKDIPGCPAALCSLSGSLPDTIDIIDIGKLCAEII